MYQNNRFLFFIITILFVCLQSQAQRSTFYVDGRFLHDPCGEKVIIRGSNAMIIYWDRLGETTYPEIAKTGANCTRIFWNARADATAEELDQTLANCWANHMIPMICVWDATGKWENIDTCIAYWQKPEIVEVLKKHEKHLLLNIANEAGDQSVSHEDYRETYSSAIKQLREAGLQMPLVIDAAHWGRDERYILDNGAYLLEQDPLKNLIFSWHPWDPEQPAKRYQEGIAESVEKELCMIIGEFSHVSVFYQKPIDYEAIIEACHENEIGWLAWVWWCCEDAYDGHTIAINKEHGEWANPLWGYFIAEEHPYGIKKTAKRTEFIEQGECEKE